MNFNTLLKDSITKGAARIVRKPFASVRHDVAALKRQVRELRRTVRVLQRAAGQQAAGLVETEDAGVLKRARRPTAAGIKRMRTKLGLTQSQFGKLLGVTSLSVSKWERAKGTVTVRNRTLAALRKARDLGKREALRILQG